MTTYNFWNCYTKSRKRYIQFCQMLANFQFFSMADLAVNLQYISPQ